MSFSPPFLRFGIENHFQQQGAVDIIAREQRNDTTVGRCGCVPRGTGTKHFPSAYLPHFVLSCIVGS